MTLSKRLLEEAHVAVVPGKPFGSDDHIRMSFATSDKVLEESANRIAAWLQKNAPLVRLRPDHRVIVQRAWNDERQRLSGVTSIVSSLAKLAA